MTNINSVLARVFVSSLDAAIPLYQELADVADVNHFTFHDVQLGQVGPFLLLAGNTAAYPGPGCDDPARPAGIHYHGNRK